MIFKNTSDYTPKNCNCLKKVGSYCNTLCVEKQKKFFYNSFGSFCQESYGNSKPLHTWASILALRSSSSLRFRMFSFSCWASVKDCRNWSKMPKNSSGCILLASSPKCFTALRNCGTKEKGLHGITFTAGHSGTMFYSVLDCFTRDSLGLSSLKSEQGTSSLALKPMLTRIWPATEYSRGWRLEPEPKLRQCVCWVFFTTS